MKNTRKSKCLDTHQHENPTHRTVVQPKKRGPKGYYKGSRLTLLESYCDEYVLLRNKSHHHFWHKLFEAWWQKYPWCLLNEEEPPLDDPTRMQALSYVWGDEDLEEKAVVAARVRKVSSFNC